MDENDLILMSQLSKEGILDFLKDPEEHRAYIKSYESIYKMSVQMLRELKREKEIQETPFTQSRNFFGNGGY